MKTSLCFVEELVSTGPEHMDNNTAGSCAAVMDSQVYPFLFFFFIVYTYIHVIY